MPKIHVPVYWGTDKNEKVVIDEDEIRKSFEEKLQAVKDDTEGRSATVIMQLKDEIYG